MRALAEMAIAFATFLCLASGFLLVSAGWSRVHPLWADVLFRASLSVGFGLGVFSVAFLIYRVFAFTSLIPLDLALFLLILCARLLLGRLSVKPLSSAPDPESPRWFQRTLIASLVVALSAALYAVLRQALAHPHGDGWDAFAIWDLHARFLFLGGAHWRDGFTQLLPWSHPDYPLLLPGSIAHFWTYLGCDAPMVPALIGLGFLFGTVGLLFAGVAALRGVAPAALAAIALLATPSFVEQGTWQYADVPLSFFFLAAIALLCLNDDERNENTTHGFQFLAGLSAGLAAWTKNEGLLFVAALIVARQWAFRRTSEQGKIRLLRHSAFLLAGVLPVFLLILGFKHWIAPQGDLFSDARSIAHRMLQPTRYWAVLQWYGKEVFRFGGWLAVPGSLLLAVFYFLLRLPGKQGPTNPGRRSSWWTLGLTLAGYALIYLITPYDIYWHLRFSLGRLFLQLWPSTVFLVFLATPGPGRHSSTVSK